jgi:hypothetical protein
MTESNAWDQLLSRNSERVRMVMNLLFESPCFYRDDNESAFHFLKRHRSEFSSFFQSFFGWILVIDNKCARVYKEKWYNPNITESNRDLFNFTKRDECIAFMMILEFFEHQLDENDMSIDEKENLRFRFGDLLEFCVQRFTKLFENSSERYTPEYLRAKVLRQVFPVLERYRFLRKVPPPQDEQVSEELTIYEALPAMYHYNSGYLHRHFDELRQSMETAAVTTDDASAGGDETYPIDDEETGNNDAENIV